MAFFQLAQDMMNSSKTGGPRQEYDLRAHGEWSDGKIPLDEKTVWIGKLPAALTGKVELAAAMQAQLGCAVTHVHAVQKPEWNESWAYVRFESVWEQIFVDK